jgi:rootletin
MQISTLKDQLSHEIRQRQLYLVRSAALTDNDINDLQKVLDNSLRKVSNNPDIDPILLEHETKKLDAAIESSKAARSLSPQARLSPSPVRRQSPTRQTARPTSTSGSGVRPTARRSSPNPVPLRSSLRK